MFLSQADHVEVEIVRRSPADWKTLHTSLSTRVTERPFVFLSTSKSEISAPSSYHAMTNNQSKIRRPWLKPRQTIPTQVIMDPQLDLVRNMIPRDRLNALTETSLKGHLELLLLELS